MPDTSHYESCLRSIKWLKRTTKWRFIITAFSLVINSIMYFAHMFLSSVSFAGGDTFLSFIFLLATLVLGAYTLYLAGSAAAYPEKTGTLCILMAVLLLGRLTNIVLNVFAFLIPLWATQFFQIKKAKWLTEQEGYPYFSERFEEQKRTGTEYVPTYTADYAVPQYDDSDLIPDETSMPDTVPAAMPEIPEMPGIPDIPAEDLQ